MSKKKIINTAEQIPGVWLATESHLQNPWRFLTFTDRGVLKLSPQQVQFYGNSQTIDMQGITEFDITYAKYPWGNLLIGVLLLVIYVLAEFQFGSHERALEFLFVMSICIATSIPLERTQLWVKIQYEDESGTPHVVYLRDGSKFGWGGILGGTLALYKKIRSIYFPKSG